MRCICIGLSWSLTALLILTVICAAAQPAYAYVDPGSGLLAFQILSTTFAGMVFMMRRRLHALLRSMTLRFGSKSERNAK
jgi:hypothetical protein